MLYDSAPFVKKTYTGVGSYTFDFKVFSTDDIRVSWQEPEGVEAIILTTGQYTPLINIDFNGGSVTVTDGTIPISGVLKIERFVSYEQGTDWVNNDNFSMELLERTQDKLVMMIQQIAYRNSTDTVTVINTIIGGTGTTATPSEMLSAIKTVDGTGSGLDADTLDGLHSSAFATAAQGTAANSALSLATAAAATANNAASTANNAASTANNAASTASSALSTASNALSKDMGPYSGTAGGIVGGLMLCSQDSGQITVGTTISGSSLKPACARVSSSALGISKPINSSYYYLGGTWRCLGYGDASTGTCLTLYQRIA